MLDADFYIHLDDDFDHFTASSDMNVVTPAGQGTACIAWFNDHHYGSWTPEAERIPATGYLGVASFFATASRVMSNGQVSSLGHCKGLLALISCSLTTDRGGVNHRKP
jgi:hypothetical protein